MYVSYVLITLSCFTSSLQGSANNPDCGEGRYFDLVTKDCHPCSDCADGRGSNIYCINECKGEVIDTVIIL